MGLRARNLKEAIDRMLNDEQEDNKGFLPRLLDSFKMMKNPDNPRITNFYNHPEIKYLGSTGIFKVPSQFKAVSFSKTLLFLLNETGYKKNTGENAQIRDPEEGDIKNIPVTDITKERIEAALNGIINEHSTATGYEKNKIVLDHETAKYVLSMWKDSYGDTVKFRLQLEAWFDRTMEQCTEWYKRKIQLMLLVLGFMMAWFFNADTFTIISKLSTDRDAREKMVTLASAYMSSHPQVPTEPAFPVSAEKLDSLNDVKKKLEDDIANANSILGLGGWAPDSAKVVIDPKTKEKKYLPAVDYVSLSTKHQEANRMIYFSHCEKWLYFLRLFCHHFFGFLITAIAISLGAPFWFDLLNKLMKLRTSQKESTSSTNTTAGGTVSPLNREA